MSRDEEYRKEWGGMEREGKEMCNYFFFLVLYILFYVGIYFYLYYNIYEFYRILKFCLKWGYGRSFFRDVI